jgi:hypothetical protein
MLRRSHILTTAALVAVCAVPTTAIAQQDLRSPDAKDAAREAGVVQTPSQDLRSPDAKDAAREAEAGSGYRTSYQPTVPPSTGGHDLRSPDAVDAAQHRGLYQLDEPKPVSQDLRSPDARDAARDLPPVKIPAPVVEIRGEPSGGFDWGDAGIGAAGMLALFSIAVGSTLLLTGRRRRRGFRVAH